MQGHKILTTIAALMASAGAVVALSGFTRPVDQSQAKTIAIKACGGGTIKSETDGGTRNGDKVYTFDVNVANKSFVEKVNVDAKTGAVLDVTYAGQQA
ncbi:MAG TPA: PepSY domain-containing protein [Gemmatimonadaceae bacterium]|nr:PepSY domain-containing protein [Gemmatimonadaceae bacterium]